MAQSFRIAGVAVGGIALTAPMSGVSDLPFRRAVARFGAPYVVTEMVAADALVQGRADVVQRAANDPLLPLTVVQLVGREARWIALGAKLAEDSGADIIDLNMGCPSREVTGVLCGAALMRELDRAESLMTAAVGATGKPVTLKMRLGWDDASRNAPELAALAEHCGVKAVTVHARTRNQFYKGRSDWPALRAVKAATSLPLIVNGDITDEVSAAAALQQSGADAVMIGRGACGRPWLAAAVNRALQDGKPLQEPGLEERLNLVLEHFRDTLAFYGDRAGLRIFRKHLAWYVEKAPWPHDSALRRVAKASLCRIEVPRDVEAALTCFWRDKTLPAYATGI
jgi:tRNA-dihydrouridine synthase B